MGTSVRPLQNATEIRSEEKSRKLGRQKRQNKMIKRDQKGNKEGNIDSLTADCRQSKKQ